MRPSKLVLSAVLVVLSSCGGDPASTPPPPAKPSDFFAGYDRADCERWASCGFIGASEKEACMATAQASATKYPLAYSVDEAVAQHRLAFDAQAAQDCIAAIAKEGCSIDQLYAFAGCDAIYAPLVPLGGACKSSLECKDGWCSGGDAGCGGTCAAFAATGAACDDQATAGPFCGRSDFCNPTTANCEPLAGAGMPCRDQDACQIGTFCIGWKMETGKPDTLGTCTSPGGIGAPCDYFLTGQTDCTPGLYCDGSVCATHLAAGAECEAFSACQDGFSCIGFTFDETTRVTTQKGHCGPILDVDQPCDPAVNEPGCPTDMLCDPRKSKCAAVGGEGDDCSMVKCRDYLYCDSSTYTCVPMIPFGAACDPNAADDGCEAGACDAATSTCALSCG